MSETSDVPFASDDVTGLTAELGQIASQLPPEQWRLLLAILDSASGHFVEVDVPTQGQSPGPPEGTGGTGDKPPKGLTPAQLLEQLRKAYKPGKAPPRKKFQITPPNVQPDPHH